jgi:hypothetical protein
VLFGMIGPLAYFAVGRKEAAVDEAAGRRSGPAADQPATAADRSATAADVLYGVRDKGADAAPRDSADAGPGESAASPPDDTPAQ